VIRPASFFLELLEQHVVGIEDLFELSNNIDAPIHRGFECCILILGATPQVSKMAKYEQVKSER